MQAIEALREWRRSTKTSQAEAAGRLGMTQQALSQHISPPEWVCF